MFCDRCAEPIGPDEEYDTVDVMSPTGPGTVVILHKRVCERAPIQTAPVKTINDRA